MNEAYVNDLEYEAQSSGGLLDWLRAGADIYTQVTRPDPVTGASTVARRPTPAPGAIASWLSSPMVIVGGVVALVALLVLVLTRK